MRLDRYLCELNIGSRSQVKEFVRKGLVSVNGQVVRSADQKIEEQKDQVAFQGKTLTYQRYVYYMLNKPRGVVSATQDNTACTVAELLAPEGRKDLFPMGRLDKDTEGLLILTNDGELTHRLLSPKRHVDKTYEVTVAHALSAEDLRRLEQGVDIGEDRLTLPARAEAVSENILHLTIQEGKYHQVKRMFEAAGKTVTYLRRESMGSLVLDQSLKPGQYRRLTDEELESL